MELIKRVELTFKFLYQQGEEGSLWIPLHTKSF